MSMTEQQLTWLSLCIDAGRQQSERCVFQDGKFVAIVSRRSQDSAVRVALWDNESNTMLCKMRLDVAGHTLTFVDFAAGKAFAFSPDAFLYATS